MKRYYIGIGGMLVESKDGTHVSYVDVCNELKERDDKIQALEGLIESYQTGEVFMAGLECDHKYTEGQCIKCGCVHAGE